MRIIIDNDFSGDPDGLVQLAHHLLSPSVDIRFVIGSHLRDGDEWDSSATTADNAVAKARHIAALTNRADVRILAGSNTGLTTHGQPICSTAALAIVKEARRDDTDLPLFVVCGASLTEVASAWLIEPGIASRLTLVWIGGHEHDGHAAPPPGGTDLEYNLAIDLFESLSGLVAQALVAGRHLGETYVLGDSPLVLLTALHTAFEPEAASSSYVTVPCPTINERGLYESNPRGRPLRVYTQIGN